METCDVGYNTNKEACCVYLTVFLVFVPPHVIRLFLLSHFRLH